MTLLSRENLACLNPGVITPQYDSRELETGIVHFGPGAFHRGHQAVFTENAIKNSGGNWGICAVSMNSNKITHSLNNQDGLYTLAIRDQNPCYRVVGIIKEALCARLQPEAVIRRLIAPSTKIVTLTITEKGYYLTASGQLDFQAPIIRGDLQAPKNPKSVVGFLVRACWLRQKLALAPLTIISCDNIANNGSKLARACRDYASKISPDLSAYIEECVLFPNTMVDSITPAMEAGVNSEINKSLGLADQVPVQREHYAQWVIENKLPADIPDWASAGVVITDDITPYENAKLLILNASHTALAYLGLLAGETSIEGAIKQPDLYQAVSNLVHRESFPAIQGCSEEYLQSYWQQTLTRFNNGKITHYLEQIAQDGSQKIPIRLFPLIEAQAKQQQSAHIACLVIAAWLVFIKQQLREGRALQDAYLMSIQHLLPTPQSTMQVFAKGMLTIEALFPKAIFSCAAIQQHILNKACDIAEHGLIASVQSINKQF